MLLTDLIQGRENKWERVYSPSRLRVKSLGEYASANISVAEQYTDYVTAGDVKSEAELRLGEGAIMRAGVSKIAVHRDKAGHVHRLSAVCPHLGCKSRGIRLSRRGIVRVMGRGSVSRGGFTRGRRIATFQLRNNHPTNANKS